MKKTLCCVAALLALVCGLSACGGNESETGDAVAYYKGEPVLRAAVEQRKQNGETGSDREIIDRMITNQILLEEAEKQGLTATEEEVETFLAETVYASYDMPEGKEWIDAYCADNGLTFEEYVDSVRELAPRTIARAKLEEAVARSYCAGHGIAFDGLNVPQEVKDALNDYKADLLERHRGDIRYHTP